MGVITLNVIKILLLVAFSCNDNIAPTVSSITPRISSGYIGFNYTIVDAESDNCSISVYFSTDGGATWTNATSFHLFGGIQDLTAAPAGISHHISWNPFSDNIALTPKDDKVRFKIIPQDQFHIGVAAMTDNFSVKDMFIQEDPIAVRIFILPWGIIIKKSGGYILSYGAGPGFTVFTKVFEPDNVVSFLDNNGLKKESRYESDYDCSYNYMDNKGSWVNGTIDFYDVKYLFDMGFADNSAHSTPFKNSDKFGELWQKFLGEYNTTQWGNESDGLKLRAVTYGFDNNVQVSLRIRNISKNDIKICDKYLGHWETLDFFAKINREWVKIELKDEFKAYIGVGPSENDCVIIKPDEAFKVKNKYAHVSLNNYKWPSELKDKNEVQLKFRLKLNLAPNIPGIWKGEIESQAFYLFGKRAGFLRTGK